MSGVGTGKDEKQGGGNRVSFSTAQHFLPTENGMVAEPAEAIRLGDSNAETAPAATTTVFETSSGPASILKPTTVRKGSWTSRLKDLESFESTTEVAPRAADARSPPALLPGAKSSNKQVAAEPKATQEVMQPKDAPTRHMKV